MKETIIINGKEYRVAVSWNAIRDYCGRKGVNDLTEIDSVLSFNIDGMLTMAHCCIKEGERLEGRKFEMTEEDLGAMMNPIEMTEFAKSYVRQATTGMSGENGTKKSGKRNA